MKWNRKIESANVNLSEFSEISVQFSDKLTSTIFGCRHTCFYSVCLRQFRYCEINSTRMKIKCSVFLMECFCFANACSCRVYPTPDLWSPCTRKRMNKSRIRTSACQLCSRLPSALMSSTIFTNWCVATSVNPMPLANKPVSDEKWP